MQDHAEVTPELDTQAISRWLEAELDVKGPVRSTLLAGGRSNLTYLLETPDQKMVLRRPPGGDLPKGAHDVIREARMLDSLAQHVPVPRIHGICEDTDVTGVPFILMEFLDGLILRTPEDVMQLTDVAVREQAGNSLVDSLIRLHQVDVRETILSGLAGRKDYLERQLKRWNGNWKHTSTRDLPDLEATYQWLCDNAPAQEGSSILHGDYRLDNCVLDQTGQVVGLLDWELATVGDPMADLGQLLVYWSEPDDEFTALANPPTKAPGFATREELSNRYLSATGADPARLEYFVVFNWWKVACIVENVYSRMLGGVMGIVDRTPESFGDQARGLAAMALRQTKSTGGVE